MHSSSHDQLAFSCNDKRFGLQRTPDTLASRKLEDTLQTRRHLVNSAQRMVILYELGTCLFSTNKLGTQTIIDYLFAGWGHFVFVHVQSLWVPSLLVPSLQGAKVTGTLYKPLNN